MNGDDERQDAAAASENTKPLPEPAAPPAIRRVEGGRFAPGFQAGPGRPRNMRDKLSRRVLELLLADFEEHGSEAVARCRQEDPAAYLRVMASLVPRDVKVTHAADGMTPQEIDAEIRRLLLGAPAETVHDDMLIEGEAIPLEDE